MAKAKQTATRRVVVVDNSAVARQIGGRIRAARIQAKLSQAALAGDRYTAAYISGLERGHAKPSMAALTYLAQRLNTTVRDLVEDKRARWTRLEADLRLAAEDWAGAHTAYEDLLQTSSDRRDRALIQRGMAEALCRLSRGAEAISLASSAAEELSALGEDAEAAIARYWLAYGHFQIDDLGDARAILNELRTTIRSGLLVQDDFKLRILVASASLEIRDGQMQQARGYLDEASAFVDRLDARRRATLLFALATQYQETGDLEAALQAGTKALALYDQASAKAEVASLKNTMAMALIDMGNLERADELLTDAQSVVERLGDERMRAHVMETRARLFLASGKTDEAADHALVAEAAAEASDNVHARASAIITHARAEIARGQPERALTEYERAASLLQERGLTVRRSEVLAEWAELLSARGDAQGANRLFAEALRIRRR